MKYFLILFLSFFSFSSQAQQVPIFVRKVYDDIYSTMDNGQVLKPSIVLSTDNDLIAKYSSELNQVVVGIELIKMARSFGVDSSNVMAHILGHELAHILLQQNDFVNKIGSGYASVSYNQQLKKIHKTLQDSVFERQADEYSALFTYMSGYKTLPIATIVLDSIYHHFHLTDKQLSRYPTLKERKLIIQNVSQRMKVLTEVFDFATIALISGKYDMAQVMFETIIKEKFPSCEIYNNLGLIHLLKAIQQLDPKEYPYVFPCEIDLVTRLKQDDERTMTEEIEDNLNEAIRNFDLALKNKNYTKAYLNKSIAEFLLKQYEASNISLKLASINNENLLTDKIKLMEIVMKHKQGNVNESLNELKILSQSNSLAELNYKNLTNSTNNQIIKKSLDSTNQLNLKKWNNQFDLIPRVDFFSPQVQELDKLKYSLKFERDLHCIKLETNESTQVKWFYKFGKEIKFSMVIIEPKNKPTFVLNTNLLENADAYYVMNEVEFIKYNSFILKFDKKKLVQFFSVN